MGCVTPSVPLVSGTQARALGPQASDFSPFGLRFGPTKRARDKAFALGAEDKVRAGCVLIAQNDANHAAGLVRARAAELTLRAQSKLVGPGVTPRVSDAERVVQDMYRSYMGHLGAGYALQQGEAAMLALGALYDAGMSPKLAPCLSLALGTKCERYAAAKAYVDSSHGPSQAIDLLLMTLHWGGKWPKSPQMQNAMGLAWDFGVSMRRVTQGEMHETQGHTRFGLPGDMRGHICCGEDAAAPQLDADTHALFESKIRLVWCSTLVGERAALRLARAMSVHELRKLDAKQPVTRFALRRLHHVERGMLKGEILGFARTATRACLRCRPGP